MNVAKAPNPYSSVKANHNPQQRIEYTVGGLFITILSLYNNYPILNLHVLYKFLLFI